MKRGILGVMLLGLHACAPYDMPEYDEIDTSETGFLIPLEGNTESQTSFDSVAYLEKRKIAAKRVQIPHRWTPMGRLPWQGDWIDTVRLVKVDRSPVTREWTAEQTTGTAKHNQAVWIESRDSVGFSVGFTCTAYIKEEDTAQFLYMYRSQSLAQMMDTEVRARIQAKASEVAARYDLDDLRARKQEILDEVRHDVGPFFKERGITITTVGLLNGFTYQNTKIQEAIDQTFVAQQQKVVAEAKFKAQVKENERIELAAQAEANQARTIARSKADAVRMIAEAAQQARQDPLFVQLKQLEVESERIARWDGHYPSYWMNFGKDGQQPQFLMPMPPIGTH